MPGKCVSRIGGMHILPDRIEMACCMHDFDADYKIAGCLHILPDRIEIACCMQGLDASYKLSI